MYRTRRTGRCRKSDSQVAASSPSSCAMPDQPQQVTCMVCTGASAGGASGTCKAHSRPRIRNKPARAKLGRTERRLARSVPAVLDLVCHCTSARLCSAENDEPRTGTSLQGLHARRTERQGSVRAESAPAISEQRFRWQCCLHESHPARIHVKTRYQLCRRCSVW